MEFARSADPSTRFGPAGRLSLRMTGSLRSPVTSPPAPGSRAAPRAALPSRIVEEGEDRAAQPAGFGVLLGYHRVRVIEAVEELRQVVHVLGEQRELEIGDRLPDDLPPPGALEDQVPQTIVDLGALERLDLVLAETTLAAPLLQLVEDLLGAYRRVLEIRTGVALEGQRLVEIKGQYPVAGLAGHEIAQGADGDHLRPVGDIEPGRRRPSIRSTTAVLGRVGEDIEELVGLDADAAAARHLDIGLFHLLVGETERASRCVPR